MVIKHINEFPFEQRKSNSPDLLFAVPLGGMGMHGLIILIINNEVYLYNFKNITDELYRKYLLLTEEYYPQLIRVVGNGSEVKNRISKCTSNKYKDYYLGMGNHLLVKSAFARKYKIKNHDYKSFAKFLEENIDNCTNLYNESLKIAIPSCLFVRWNDKQDLQKGLEILKNNRFKWVNSKEIDLEKDFTSGSQSYLCIDFNTNKIGFMPAMSLSCGILYFDAKNDCFENLVNLHLKTRERDKKYE